jgi:hypothetical protein
MYKSIAAAAGLAVLLATGAPAQAQNSAGRTTSSAAKRVVLKVKSSGGTSAKARCGAQKRGRSLCSVTFRARDGRRCADTRVTVVRKRGRLSVKGFAPACRLAPSPGTQEPAATQPAPEGVPEAVETPTEMPGPPDSTTGGSPLFDPGAGVPGGPPPGAGSTFDRPPGAPTAAKRTAIARASSENNSFLGCTDWQADWWYGQWWMYVCYWSYSSAPAGAHLIGWQTSYVAQVYYWTGTGSQSAFWFRHEWTA